MSPTIREMALDGKVCQSCDLGLIQEVISPHLIQSALSVSDAWEERERRPDMLLLWDSGLHCSCQIFLARQRQSHVLGALKSNVLTKPVERLVDGSYLTYIYEDQDHHAGARLLVLSHERWHVGQATREVKTYLRLRFQARVVKRTRSKFERKLPLHLKAPPLEPGVDFKDLIALVT